MPEGFELPEVEEHDKHPLVLPVSLTISILAVFVAGITLLGHRAHTEELLLQSQATDQWAFYQAKNIRLHEMQSMVDLLGTHRSAGQGEKRHAPREISEGSRALRRRQGKHQREGQGPGKRAGHSKPARRPLRWRRSAGGNRTGHLLHYTAYQAPRILDRRHAHRRRWDCFCGDWFPGALDGVDR